MGCTTQHYEKLLVRAPDANIFRTLTFTSISKKNVAAGLHGTHEAFHVAKRGRHYRISIYRNHSLYILLPPAALICACSFPPYCRRIGHFWVSQTYDTAVSVRGYHKMHPTFLPCLFIRRPGCGAETWCCATCKCGQTFPASSICPLYSSKGLWTSLEYRYVICTRKQRGHPLRNHVLVLSAMRSISRFNPMHDAFTTSRCTCWGKPTVADPCARCLTLIYCYWLLRTRTTALWNSRCTKQSCLTLEQATFVSLDIFLFASS